MDIDTLHIKEAAALVGATPKALRHYERIGLLNPKREENGYRLYGPADILRLERIRQMQHLGLSLERIQQILDEVDNEDLWQLVLEGLLDEIEQDIDELEERRSRVLELLDGEQPDAISERTLVPISPRVQAYLDEHLEPEMWLKEQDVYAQLQTLIRPATEPLIYAYPQIVPEGMPTGIVGWYEPKSGIR